MHPDDDEFPFLANSDGDFASMTDAEYARRECGELAGHLRDVFSDRYDGQLHVVPPDQLPRDPEELLPILREESRRHALIRVADLLDAIAEGESPSRVFLADRHRRTTWRNKYIVETINWMRDIPGWNRKKVERFLAKQFNTAPSAIRDVAKRSTNLTRRPLQQSVAKKRRPIPRY